MVVLPVRRGDTLDAFVTLGEKRSGDVYTATDLALLAAVVAQLSGELIRLDLGRYTSRDVVDVFVRDPGALAPQPRDVTIFFSDIRGSTTIAERLSRDALHQLQNEYFEAMADGIAAFTLAKARRTTASSPRNVLPATMTARLGEMRKNRSSRGLPCDAGAGSCSESNLRLPVTVTRDGSAPRSISRRADSSLCMQKRSMSASTRLKNGRRRR